MYIYMLYLYVHVHLIFQYIHGNYHIVIITSMCILYIYYRGPALREQTYDVSLVSCRAGHVLLQYCKFLHEQTKIASKSRVDSSVREKAQL